MASGSFAEPTPAFAQATAGADREQRRATPAAAFERALETFVSGERLDMAALAADMGVARTTLYRWTGDRERLLSDLSWAEMSSMLIHLHGQAKQRGVERLCHVAGEYFTVLSSGRLQAFLAAEGETGLRLVTDLSGGVRPRLVELVESFIVQEATEGHYVPPEDPRLLADVIVSLGERFLHHGGDPTMNPDIDTARRAIALLLRENGA